MWTNTHNSNVNIEQVSPADLKDWKSNLDLRLYLDYLKAKCTQCIQTATLLLRVQSWKIWKIKFLILGAKFVIFIQKLKLENAEYCLKL